MGMHKGETLCLNQEQRCAISSDLTRSKSVPTVSTNLTDRLYTDLWLAYREATHFERDRRCLRMPFRKFW